MVSVAILPLLLSVLQSDDPRLDVKATLLQPRVTYAEFGQWVQKSTGVAVLVSPAIRDRKMTVLVEDRPVKETMDKVSEALFIEWEKTKDGYTMRIPTKILSEEQGMRDLAASVQRDVMRKKLEEFVALSHKSVDQMKIEEEGVRNEAIALAKDTSPGAADRRAELTDRAALLSNLIYGGYMRGMAMIVAQFTPGQRDAVFRGQTLYAANPPQSGVAPIPKAAIAQMRENMGMLSEDKPMLFAINYKPEQEKIELSYGCPQPTGASGGGTSIHGDDSAAYRLALANAPLGKRLAEWTKTDPAILATKLPPAKPAAKERHQTTYKTLADLLVDLHRRSGLPIVADGFRQAVVGKMLPDGADFAAWLRSLGPWSDGRFRGYRPLVRGQGGWLMMRHPQYWRQVVREVPEEPIRKLEAASAKPTWATLDDFAAFASAVTPAQAPWLGQEDLVMEAPNAAVEGKVNALKLWAMMPSVVRKQATSELGVPINRLGTPLQQQVWACLNERRGSVFGSSKEVAYLLPGGFPWPNDALVKFNLDSSTMNMDTGELVQDDPDNTGWNSMTDSVPAVYVSIGTNEVSLQSYSIPLRPSRKLWGDKLPPGQSPGFNGGNG